MKDFKLKSVLIVLFFMNLVMSFAQIDSIIPESFNFTNITVSSKGYTHSIDDCLGGLIEDPSFESGNIGFAWYSTVGTPNFNSGSVTMVALRLGSNNKTEGIVQTLPILNSQNYTYTLEMDYLFNYSSLNVGSNHQGSIEVFLGNSSLVDNNGFNNTGAQHIIPNTQGFQSLVGIGDVDNSTSNNVLTPTNKIYSIEDGVHKLRISFNYNQLLGNDRLFIFPKVNSTNTTGDDAFAVNISNINIYCDEEPCMFKSVNLLPSENYWLSAWVNVEDANQLKTYQLNNPNQEQGAHLEVDFLGLSTVPSLKLYPTGNIIDGWQRIVGKVDIPAGTTDLNLKLNADNTRDTYFDDIRLHPFNASMKSYVYDGETFWLTSELDDNNYATFYEYDNEGGLIRIKKETERGIVTIQETRSSSPKTN